MNEANRIDVDYGDMKNTQGLEHLDDVASFVLSHQGKIASHMSIAIISEEQMRQYNKQYRGLDSSTDVLSFAVFSIIQGTFPGPTPNAGLPQEYAFLTIPVPPVAKIKLTSG